MKKLLVSLLAIAGLVACTNDEVVNVQKGNPITFDSFVENATRANDPSTTTNSLNAFRAWAYMDNTTGVVLNDELVEKVGSVWSYVNTQYWMPRHTYYFAALAPVDGNWALNTEAANNYGAGIVNFINFDGSEDLLYAATAVESQEKDNLPVKFQFSHLLSKINFTFVNGFATSNVDVEVKNVTMTAPASASINLAVENWWDNNDDWKNLPATNDLTLAFGDVVRLDAGDSATATDERLTIPASAEREYEVEFDVVVYSGAVPSNFHKTATIKGVAFEMGKAYNLTATISPESLDLEAIEFEVAVNEWEQAGNNVSVSELQAAAILGGEYTLTEDLELTTPLEVAAPFTLNLDGNTLTGAIELAEGVELTINDGTIVNGDKSVSGITSNGELTLNNVNIESARHAVRVESGVVYIYGGEYKVKPVSKSTLHALNVGDDNTTAEVYIYGGTFIGPKGTQADSGSAVKVRNGSKVEIYGGDFSGGKLKTLANDGTLTVKGGTFDQDPAAFVADGYKVIEKNSKYVVVADEVDDAASTNEELIDALSNAQSGDVIYVVAGDYTSFPSSVAADVTIECEEGTVFNGTSSLNINGSTVIGATFQSGSNNLVANYSTINGTFKNCVFNGDLKFSKAGDTVVFENCVFNGPDYALHFDTAVANSHVILKGCEVNSEWRVAIGAAVSMFEAIDTEFNVAGFINLWGKAKFTNCAFNKPYYWICCMDTTEFTNCTCESRALVANDIRIEDTVITINNELFTSSNEGLKFALENNASIVNLVAGNYELSGLNFVANNVTLKGVDKANVVLNLEKSIYLQNKSVTLENLTYNLNAGKDYTEQAFAFVHHATAFNLKNCNVNRLRLNVYEANIEDCTFTLNTSSGFDGYCIYYYGNDNSTVNVKNSTFATAGKGICIYSEHAKAYNLNVDKCSFTSSDSATDKAAIQMHTELGISGNVKITETTATGFANINGGLWNELNNNTKVATDMFDIWVDGTQVH